VSRDRAPSGSSVAVEVTAPPIGTVHQPPAPNSICVLLVEDDHVLRAVSADTLNDLGYRTIRTSDGMQALTALESDRDIRILMTDIGLPGMDGQQLAAEARRRRPGLGVLFVTGYDDLIGEGRLHRDEGIEYLAKPYGCDDLARVLRRLLGSESKS
jgi:DNA-binding NtrC family response regulator